MAEGFASRAQMGWMWRNKRDLYDKKLPAQAGDIAKLPYRIGSRKLNKDQRALVRAAHAKLKRGEITTKDFEKVFRDQFARAAYVPTGQRRGRRPGAKDTRPRKGFIGKTWAKIGKFFKQKRRRR